MEEKIYEKARLRKLLGGNTAVREWVRILDAADAEAFEAAVGMIKDPSDRLCAITHAGRHARDTWSFMLKQSFSRVADTALTDYQTQLTPLQELDAVSLAFDILRYNDKGGLPEIDNIIIQNLSDRFRPSSDMTDAVRNHAGDLLRDYLDDRRLTKSCHPPKFENHKAHELAKLIMIVKQPRPGRPVKFGTVHALSRKPRVP